uniref:NEL-type E3 ubiquitin ligase domain-containing protein n=1 Tax=Bordetella sputigena TaxID=1416810 RepID=UPI0039EFE055
MPPPHPLPPAMVAARGRQKLAYKVGAEVGRQLGWKRNKYTVAELTELGTQLIADHALHGDPAARLRLLATLTSASGTPQPPASPGAQAGSQGQTQAAPAGPHDKLAGQITDFLFNEFQHEFAVSLAAEDLAALRRPTDPADFDRYAQAATDKTVALVDRWLSWIGEKVGSDLKHTHIEIQAARLQVVRREVVFTINNTFVNDASVQEEVAASGYIATIRANGVMQRYFLSTLDGGIHPIPYLESTTGWAERYPDIVFGVPREHAAPGARTSARRSRIVLQPFAQGGRAELRAWLTPEVLARFNRLRPAGGAPRAEGIIDTLLDFVPFRRAMLAIRDGDYETAALSGAVDMITLAMPMIGGGFRAAADAAAGLAPAVQAIGRELAAEGLARAGAAALSRQEMRAGIKAVLQSLHGSGAMARGLRPLDIDGMAAALRDRCPRIANALRREAARTRDEATQAGWRLPDAQAARAATDDIAPLSPIAARGPDGGVMTLLTYGSDAARAYTRAHPSGKRTGAVLLADRDGWLHPSLPADTLRRYRVADPALLRSLAACRVEPDGVISSAGKTYARIAGDYVEIVPEPASTSTRPVWRVVAPGGVRRDIVFHRLAYDRDKALWLRADPGGLKGGQGGALSPEQPKRTRPEGGAPPDQAGSSRRQQPAGAPAGTLPAAAAIPAALPPMAPGSPKLNAFKQTLLSRMTDTSPGATDGVRTLLDRIQSDPRGRTLLGAMCAHQDLMGGTADIVLVDAEDPSRPRPSLAFPVRGTRWNLNLTALNAGTLEAAVNELAAVYNNLTGLAQGADPYAAMLRNGGPPLSAVEEDALARWVGRDKGYYTGNPAAFMPSPRQAAADKLRSQLRIARCHGGVDKTTLLRAMRNHPGARVPGLSLDLSGLRLTEIPPLPADVRGLRLDNNPITDWSRLPATLVSLNAAQTSATVLDHLPRDLRDLDISENALETIPVHKLPRGLKSLTAEANTLTRIPADLPHALTHLSLTDNALATWPPALPAGLRVLKLCGNHLRLLPDNLPRGLETLELSQNLFWRIRDNALPPRLKTLGLSDNPNLDLLPALPETLTTLHVDATALTALPENLPRGLRQLYANELGLTRLPDDLPRGMTVLAIGHNRLTHLPATITELTRCDIYLEENPIDPANLPALPAGQHGPIFHIPSAAPEPRAEASRTVAQAVRHWLAGSHEDAAARWEILGERLENSTAHRSGAAQFRQLLDKLRRTPLHGGGDSHAHICEWLEELVKPEREALLNSTLAMCDGATERCEDRVMLSWNELRKSWVEDDIRLGRYDGRTADALAAMLQLFREQKLQEIAHRKIAIQTAAGEDPDDVEVYLAYIVGLRERLKLSKAPAEMVFSNLSGVTDADLAQALDEVRKAEDRDFYKNLVVDDTWSTLIKRALPERYARAEARKNEQAGTPLREKIRAALRAAGLNPNDEDAYGNIAPGIWRDMLFDILEPLTRDYLLSAGVALPAGARP